MAVEPFLGQIQPFAFNFAPRGWATCDGQLLPIASHTALFSLIGTTYGGDGRTTFGLPDLRGRVAMHTGTGPGLAIRPIGEKFGSETTTLSVSNMPAHSHTLRASGEAGDSGKPEDNVLASTVGNSYSTAIPDLSMSNDAISNTGSGQAFDNMPPFLVVNWCIALVGVFPTRN